MVNEDILTSLRNGLQRQQPLQEVIQSLINSGYNSQEVYAAANSLDLGVTGNLAIKEQKSQIKSDNDSQNTELPSLNHEISSNKENTNSSNNIQSEQPKKKSKLLILTIIIIILLFLAAALIFGSNWILENFLKPE